MNISIYSQDLLLKDFAFVLAQKINKPVIILAKDKALNERIRDLNSSFKDVESILDEILVFYPYLDYQINSDLVVIYDSKFLPFVNLPHSFELELAYGDYEMQGQIETNLLKSLLFIAYRFKKTFLVPIDKINIINNYPLVVNYGEPFGHLLKKLKELANFAIDSFDDTHYLLENAI